MQPTAVFLPNVALRGRFSLHRRGSCYCHLVNRGSYRLAGHLSARVLMQPELQHISQPASPFSMLHSLARSTIGPASSCIPLSPCRTDVLQQRDNATTQQRNNECMQLQDTTLLWSLSKAIINSRDLSWQTVISVILLWLATPRLFQKTRRAFTRGAELTRLMRLTGLLRKYHDTSISHQRCLYVLYITNDEGTKKPNHESLRNVQ